jgi:hypothetical protein
MPNDKDRLDYVIKKKAEILWLKHNNVANRYVCRYGSDTLLPNGLLKRGCVTGFGSSHRRAIDATMKKEKERTNAE